MLFRSICRCLLHEPDLLLLDEPDSNLDAEGREIARGLLGPAEDRTRVIVTHDPERALPGADWAVVLGRDGKVARDCPAADLDPALARTAAIGAAT